MANWSLFGELDGLKKEIDEAFRRVGFDRPLAGTFLSAASARRFPLLNLSEDEERIYLEALLPGVDAKDLDLSLLRNSITISGKRNPPPETQGELVHRSELGFGTFSRTIDLPVEIDTQRASADCHDGVLRVTMTKSEYAKPRKIQINLS